MWWPGEPCLAVWAWNRRRFEKERWCTWWWPSALLINWSFDSYADLGALHSEQTASLLMWSSLMNIFSSVNTELKLQLHRLGRGQRWPTNERICSDFNIKFKFLFLNVSIITCACLQSQASCLYFWLLPLRVCRSSYIWVVFLPQLTYKAVL